jgi:uncharacterized membrane protein YfcA
MSGVARSKNPSGYLFYIKNYRARRLANVITNAIKFILMIQVIFLLLAGGAAGALNAIGGGGKLLVLPVLLATGMTPLGANITCNLVLCPGAMGAVWRYRRQLAEIPRRQYALLVPVLLGTAIGLVWLQKTSSPQFARLAPWLALSGVAMFILQPFLSKHMRWSPVANRPRVFLLLIGLCLFAAAIYGGYFGAGFGFVLMALLGLANITNVYQLSAIKNLTGGTMELMGLIYFADNGGIIWRQGLVAMVGCIIGGVVGAHWALKTPPPVIRAFITTVGVLVVILFFMQVR